MLIPQKTQPSDPLLLLHYKAWVSFMYVCVSVIICVNVV